ncbi:MAG: Holliday junction branch migration protein RuvA [Roseburia sp.]|nr:Holliday junction branch migration protein RuvA [Roseburia sp.]
MIGYLKGKVLNLGADSAIIVVGGVGYEVYCSGSAFSKMTEGAECEVYTYLQVSEANGVQLYGFSSLQEKSMFLKLISVSGVGPKMGIAVLSQMNVNDIAAAVVSGDVKRLSSVKGLGKKTAERIILELRENMSLPKGAVSGGVAPVINVTSGDEDAVVALMSLGFTRAESERAVSKAKAGGAKSIEDIIMVALKGM